MESTKWSEKVTKIYWKYFVPPNLKFLVSIVEQGETHPLSKMRSSVYRINTCIAKIDQLAEIYAIDIILQVESKLIRYFRFYK